MQNWKSSMSNVFFFAESEGIKIDSEKRIFFFEIKKKTLRYSEFCQTLQITEINGKFSNFLVEKIVSRKYNISTTVVCQKMCKLYQKNTIEYK